MNIKVDRGSAWVKLGRHVDSSVRILKDLNYIQIIQLTV